MSNPSIQPILRRRNSKRLKRRIACYREFLQAFIQLKTRRAYTVSIERIHTAMNIPEKVALYRLASDLPENATIVEIGSYHGASSAVMASAAEKHSLRVHCIDTWQNDAVSDASEDIFGTFLANTFFAGETIVTHRGDCHEVNNQIDFPVNMLFVDGDHSYEGAKRDFEIYLPKINPQGVLAMHDMTHPGVQQAFDEVVAPHVGECLVVLNNLAAVRIQ